jgi:lysophospholipase L1-like esterase
MPRIEEIDKNFSQTVSEDGLFYMDVLNAPVKITGLPWLKKNRNFHRMDEEFFSQYSDGVRWLSQNTAGAEICFKTNSKKLGIRVELECINEMSHMARNGIAGVDVYIGSGKNKKFYNVAHALVGADKYSAVLWFDGNMNELTLNLPLYAGVKKMELGFLPEASIEPASEYEVPNPILFYGSSITQGGCASRPGNAYTHVLGRAVDAEIINLGFSGNGMGEMLMAEQIASLELSAFIMDYDHNAPTPEHLKKTHEPFFKCIRNRHPELPVIFVTKPDVDNDIPTNIIRKGIIYETYKNALDNGDKKVWYVDGFTLFGKDNRDACTVDGCHPNDLGFYRMAEAILPALREAVKSK